VSSVDGEASRGWRRLGGMTGGGVGVKVRAELDRVSGLALMPTPIPSTMLRRLPASQGLCGGPFVVELGYVSSGWGVLGSAERR
jgi:hypothetical protein